MVLSVLQVDEYDLFLSGYQEAAVATENVAAVLNAGQGVILSSGLTAVLAAAALFSPVGSFTAGDLVRLSVFAKQWLYHLSSSACTACQSALPSALLTEPLQGFGGFAQLACSRVQHEQLCAYPY